MLTGNLHTQKTKPGAQLLKVRQERSEDDGPAKFILQCIKEIYILNVPYYWICGTLVAQDST